MSIADITQTDARTAVRATGSEKVCTSG